MPLSVTSTEAEPSVSPPKMRPSSLRSFVRACATVSQTADVDAPFGGYGLRQIGFRGAVDRDAEFVARADDVVVGRGDLEVGFEREFGVVEQIVSVDPVQRIQTGHLWRLYAVERVGRRILHALRIVQPHGERVRLVHLCRPLHRACQGGVRSFARRFARLSVDVERAVLILGLEPFHLFDRDAFLLEHLHGLFHRKPLTVALLRIFDGLRVRHFLGADRPETQQCASQ